MELTVFRLDRGIKREFKTRCIQQGVSMDTMLNTMVISFLDHAKCQLGELPFSGSGTSNAQPS
jgi:hypothetical protein